MKQRFIIRICLYMALALPFFLTHAMAAGNEKSARLEKAMAEISAMSHQLAQLEAEATDIRGQLISQLDGIESETRREIRQTGRSSPPSGIENPKIFYNMKLMGELQGYIHRYSQKIKDYRLAHSQLRYLYQYADDDLKIIHTLSNIKIDALITQIQNTLVTYANDARALRIHPETIKAEPVEKVWERLRSEK